MIKDNVIKGTQDYIKEYICERLNPLQFAAGIKSSQISLGEIITETEKEFRENFELPALHATGDGFEQGEATESEMNNLVQRKLATYDDETGEYDLRHINYLYAAKMGEIFTRKSNEVIEKLPSDKFYITFKHAFEDGMGFPESVGLFYINAASQAAYLFEMIDEYEAELEEQKKGNSKYSKEELSDIYAYLNATEIVLRITIDADTWPSLYKTVRHRSNDTHDYPAFDESEMPLDNIMDILETLNEHPGDVNIM